MQDINSVVLVARLTRDSELKYTASGFAILNFSVASNRSVKRNDIWEDEVSFFNCTLFGKRAESLAQYLLKGKQVALNASLKQDRWQDQEGHNRSTVKLMVENIQFIGGKPSQTVAPAAPAPAADPDPDIEPMPDDFDDQIPF